MLDGMELGYIKLWRKVKWKWLRNTKLWAFWTWCLLKASHKEHSLYVGATLVHLKPGQFVFGLQTAAEETGQSIQNIRTHLKVLEKTERNLTRETTHQFSIISICNWKVYQPEKPKGNKQTNKQATGRQQASNNKQECKKGIMEESYIYKIVALFIKIKEGEDVSVPSDIVDDILMRNLKAAERIHKAAGGDLTAIGDCIEYAAAKAKKGKLAEWSLNYAANEFGNWKADQPSDRVKEMKAKMEGQKDG